MNPDSENAGFNEGLNSGGVLRIYFAREIHLSSTNAGHVDGTPQASQLGRHVPILKLRHATPLDAPPEFKPSLNPAFSESGFTTDENQRTLESLRKARKTDYGCDAP